jgi:hypothetical protein
VPRGLPVPHGVNLLSTLCRPSQKQSLFVGFTEPEAAALLGIKSYVLRDCRRRGELQGAKVGSKIVYTRADLLEFLERQKGNS